MAVKRIIFLSLVIIVTFLLDCTLAIVGGLLASENYYRESRSVVLIDNNPAYGNRFNSSIVSPYCSGSLISAWHVLTHGTCCSEETLDQRVKVGSDDPKNRGYYLPVLNFTLIGFRRQQDKWMSLCVIRLRIPTTEPLLRFPASAHFRAHGTKLVWMGFGSNDRNKFTDLHRQTVSLPATTSDKENCISTYFNLPGITESDYCIHMGVEINALTLMDNGGPLFSPNSNTMWGVGVAFFPDWEKRKGILIPYQLFVGVAQHRYELLRAMKEMDAGAKSLRH